MTFDFTIGYVATPDNIGQKVIGVLLKKNSSTRYVVILDGRPQMVTKSIFNRLVLMGITDVGEFPCYTGGRYKGKLDFRNANGCVGRINIDDMVGKKTLKVFRESTGAVENIPVNIYKEKDPSIVGATYIQIQALLETIQDVRDYDIGISSMIYTKCDGKVPDTGCKWDEYVSREI